MKQTVEEAANEYCRKHIADLTGLVTAVENGFKAGAEWQKQQSYTEDQIKQAILDYCDENGMDDEEAKECEDDFINNFLIVLIKAIF